MTAPPGNALETLTDVQLWNAQVMLAVACGRNHAVLTRKRRYYFCILRDHLILESQRRGQAYPLPPHGVGDMKRDPTAL